MKAWVIDEPGRSGLLRMTEVPRPEPGDGEVLIRVAATALNRADVLQRQGRYPAPPGIDPRIPGLECSGEIIEVATGVEGLSPGDQVCALLGGGGYAEYVAVPAVQVLPVPRGMTVADAAALPEAASTVWANLGLPQPPAAGSGVLVHGGSSGVGSFAVRLAKAWGCVVAATAGGAQRCAEVREIGADIAIDYRADDFAEVLEQREDWPGAAVIFDIVGAPALASNLRSLAVGGRLMLVSTQGGAEASIDLGHLMRRRISVHGQTVRSRPVTGPESKAELIAGVRDSIWPLVESGSVLPVIGARVPIEQAMEFHRASEGGALPVGKVVFELPPSDREGPSMP